MGDGPRGDGEEDGPARLCKYLPLEPDVAAAIEGVDRAEFEFDMPATGTGEEHTQGEEQPAGVNSKPAALAAQIKGKVVDSPRRRNRWLGRVARGGTDAAPVARRRPRASRALSSPSLA